MIGQFPLAAAVAAIKGAILLRTMTLLVVPPSWVVPPAVIHVTPEYIQYIRDWDTPLSGIFITELLVIWSPLTPAMLIPVSLLTRTTLFVNGNVLPKTVKDIDALQRDGQSKVCDSLNLNIVAVDNDVFVDDAGLSPQFQP